MKLSWLPHHKTLDQVDEVEVAHLGGLGPGHQSVIVSLRWVRPSRAAWSRIRSVVSVLIEFLRMASGEAGIIGQRSGGDPQIGVPAGQQRRQRLEQWGPGRLVGLDCCGGGAGVAVGQTIQVRSVDDPLTAAGRPGMAGEPAATVGGGTRAWMATRPPAGSGWICRWTR